MLKQYTEAVNKPIIKVVRPQPTPRSQMREVEEVATESTEPLLQTMKLTNDEINILTNYRLREELRFHSYDVRVMIWLSVHLRNTIVHVSKLIGLMHTAIGHVTLAYRDRKVVSGVWNVTKKVTMFTLAHLAGPVLPWTRDRRYQICRSCSTYQKSGDTCTKIQESCGCGTWVLAKQKHRTRLRVTKCPEERWGGQPTTSVK